MKTIEIDDELYQYIAGQTLHIGESASSILRRLLAIDKMDMVISDKPESNLKVSTLERLIHSDEFRHEKKQVNRFLAILSGLYECNSGLFSVAATSLHGSKRRYLAKDEQTLIKSGSNTKPKQIPNSPYWVITNSNTARKVYTIELIMQSMNIEPSLIDTVKQQFELKNV